MKDEDALTLIDVFSSQQGKRALEILEERARVLIRIDQAPVSGYPGVPASGNNLGSQGYGGKPNEAFLNPNAALYRAGMEDQIFFIRRLIKKKEKTYGYNTITLDSIIQGREDEQDL